MSPVEELNSDRSGSAHSSRSSGTKKRPTGHRKRKWVRRLALIVVLIAVLILLAPYILSTGFGPMLANHLINGQIAGKVHISNLSLSWTGPCSAGGVRIYDSLGREVLNTDIAWNRGLWDAIKSWEDFGQVHLNSPEVVLYEENGTVSLAEAFQPRTKQDRPATRVSISPHGTIQLKVGKVRVVQPDGREYAVHEVDMHVLLGSLNDIQVEAKVEFAEAGRLKGQFNVTDVFPAGTFEVESLKLSADLSTPEPIALGPLASFAGRPMISGNLNLAMHVKMEKGKPSGTMLAFVTGLIAPLSQPSNAAATDGPKPIDVAVMAAIYQNGQATAQPFDEQSAAKLRQNPVWLNVDVAYQPDVRLTDISAGEIVSAFLVGKPAALPGIDIQVEGQADLIPVGLAIPGILNLRPDTRITGGQLDIKRIEATGGDHPRVQGDIRLVDLSAVRDQKEIRFEPISLVLDSIIVPDEGLKINQAEFTSAFGQASLSGTAKTLTGQFEANLDKLHQQLAEIVDLGDLNLQGLASGHVRLTRRDENRIDVLLSMNTRGVQYKARDVNLTLAKSSLNLPATLDLKGNRIETIRVDGGRLVLNEHVVLGFGMTYNLQTQALSASTVLEPSALNELTPLASGFVSGLPEQMNGVLEMQTKLSRAGAGAPLIANSSGAVRDLQIKGKPVGAKQMRYTLTGLEYSPDVDRAKVKLLAVDAETLGKGSVQDFEIVWSDQLRMAGQVHLDVDVGKMLAAIQPLTTWERPPAVEGQLSWSASASTSGDTVTVSGQAKISDLQVGRGEKKFTEKKATLVHDATIDIKQDMITLRNCVLSSVPISVNLKGTVREYRTKRLLNFKGSYKTSWDQLTVLLHEFVPGTEDMVFAGAPSSDFQITGSAYEPQIIPVYRDVQASGFRVGWASAKALGLDLGPANLAMNLKNARINMPITSVAASGGTLRLGGLVDLTKPTPVYRLAEKTQIMENLHVDKNFGHKVLSRLNPVFANLVWMEGVVGLSLTDIELPLGEEIFTSGRGRGHLNLDNFRIRPAGFLATLVKLSSLRTSGTYGIKVNSLDFVIRDGRIYYDNFVLTLGKNTNMTFRGSVGFDGSVELWVKMSLTVEMFKRFGVKGPLDRYAKLLALDSIPIEIPIAGNRLQPKLGKVDLQPIIRNLVRNLLLKHGSERLDELLGVRAGPVPTEVRKKVTDLLMSILRDEVLQLKKITKPGPATQPTTRTKLKGREALNRLLKDLLQGSKKKSTKK